MRLVIVDREGNVHEVVEDLESYDLNAYMARAALALEIQTTIKRIPEEQR